MRGALHSRGGAGWLLALGFAASRLVHITALPAFIDESIYLFWARQIATDGRFWRPLADGKSLQVWTLTAVVPWVFDPLPWGRLVSALAGALGMWTAWAIARRLQGDRAGLIAAGLYVLCPFALFHDRMVLADVFLSTAAALTLLASLRAIERPTAARGLVLGLALTACALSKIPGLLMWATPLFAALALERRPGLPKCLATGLGVATLFSVFPVAYFFANSAQVQEQAAVADVGGPLAVVAPNVATLAGWLWTYWTPGVLAVFAVAAVLAGFERRRDELLLVASALWSPLVFACLARSWFPRYVFPATIPALVLTALALSRLVAQVRSLRRAWILLLAAGAALLVPALRFDAALLTKPEEAPFPAVDRFQYVEGWTAGYGREEMSRALVSALTESPGGILVGVGGATRHAWRPLHLLLRARFMNDPRVEIDVADPQDPAQRRALLERAAGRPLFLVAGVEGETLPDVGARPLLIGRTPDGMAVTALYRLSPGTAPN